MPERTAKPHYLVVQFLSRVSEVTEPEHKPLYMQHVVETHFEHWVLPVLFCCWQRFIGSWWASLAVSGFGTATAARLAPEVAG